MRVYLDVCIADKYKCVHNYSPHVCIYRALCVHICIYTPYNICMYVCICIYCTVAMGVGARWSRG